MHTLLKPRSENPSTNTLLSNNCSLKGMVQSGISARLRQQLLYMHVSSFDWQLGGLKLPIKFLDRDSIEYSLSQAVTHDKNEERMARLSLQKGMQLIDANAGGIYQFATGNNWQECRYSKSIAAQAGCLRLYSLAYALFREHCYLQTTRNIHNYLYNTLLTDEGIFRSTRLTR